MGKSMVLKDEKNRPRGYVISSNGQITCRAQMSDVSSALLFFQDGTQQSIELTNGKERCVSCKGKDLAGCCVFCGSSIVLTSDDAVRYAYERSFKQINAGRKKETVLSGSEDSAPQVKYLSQAANEIETQNRQKNNCENARIFAQRRWPPHPCWEDACYRMGKWQESEIGITKEAAVSGGNTAIE